MLRWKNFVDNKESIDLVFELERRIAEFESLRTTEFEPGKTYLKDTDGPLAEPGEKTWNPREIKNVMDDLLKLFKLKREFREEINAIRADEEKGNKVDDITPSLLSLMS